ncbi:MAG TPA: TraR/DksA C4-type zinc finger protein [Leptospiraceae bacterium]|nr:TraR/DksA C4-type zinc finger protein [Leptospiraceae bacterium]HMW03704.1 TraR/DksA C4-type zinc finger protein [Leptospiraceae bacterium]HMX34897.1 TraR/DksA C4-type zinc finger protein [Leptospiraceae bacterium]HMY29684.1 TraR/DksA C4-type zinc finger protein [Leptospiraceae bacterium]HMZ64040.1 TraR/DksA C4-type zinc finger protein [Leptospiraceae bacterium]
MAAKSSQSKSSSSSKGFEELKEALLEKKNELLVKLNTWEDKSSPSGLKEVGDIADIASEINEEALSSVLTENEIDLLNQIEIALEKIEKGTYGICEGTKKKIPYARLKAIPWTPYTVEYAEIAAKQKAKISTRTSDTASYPAQPMDTELLD